MPQRSKSTGWRKRVTCIALRLACPAEEAVMCWQPCTRGAYVSNGRLASNLRQPFYNIPGKTDIIHHYVRAAPLRSLACTRWK